MSYYMLVSIEVLDPERYAEYRANVSATIESHGGRYLVRGGEATPFEGPHDDEIRHVVLEFPDRTTAERWWISPDYAEVKKLREGAARMTIVGVEGI